MNEAMLIGPPASNRPDVQSQHPGAGNMLAGGPPPQQGQPPGYVGGPPPQGQGPMQYK